MTNLCVLAVLFVASPAHSSQTDGERTKQFDKTVALPSGGYLSLNATKGSVKLTSWDRDEVAIHALVRRRATSTPTMPAGASGRRRSR